MAAPAYISFDQENRSGTGDPISRSVTIPALCRAVCVSVTHIGSSTDHYLVATLGGVAMTRVTAADATDAAGELCRTADYFLGAGIPAAGAVTLAIDLASATDDDMTMCVAFFSADGDCEVIDTDVIGADTADPSVTMNYGGRSAMTFGVITSGHDALASVVENANMTEVASNDFGTMVTRTHRQTTGGTSDFVFSYTATSEDCAMSVISFAAIAASGRAPVVGGGFIP